MHRFISECMAGGIACVVYMFEEYDTVERPDPLAPGFSADTADFDEQGFPVPIPTRKRCVTFLGGVARNDLLKFGDKFIQHTPLTTEMLFDLSSGDFSIPVAPWAPLQMAWTSRVGRTGEPPWCDMALSVPDLNHPSGRKDDEFFDTRCNPYWRLLLMDSMLNTRSKFADFTQLGVSVTERVVRELGVSRFFNDASLVKEERWANLWMRVAGRTNKELRDRVIALEPILCAFKLSRVAASEKAVKRAVSKNRLPFETVNPTNRQRAFFKQFYSEHYNKRLPEPSVLFSVPVDLALDFTHSCPVCGTCNGLDPVNGTVLMAYAELAYPTRRHAERVIREYYFTECEKIVRSREAKIPNEQLLQLDMVFSTKRSEWTSNAAVSNLNDLLDRKQGPMDMFQTLDSEWSREFVMNFSMLESTFGREFGNDFESSRVQTGLAPIMDSNFDVMQHALCAFPPCVMNVILRAMKTEKGVAGEYPKWDARNLMLNFLNSVWSAACGPEEKVHTQAKMKVWYECHRNTKHKTANMRLRDFSSTQVGKELEGYKSSKIKFKYLPPSCDKCMTVDLCPFSQATNKKTFENLCMSLKPNVRPVFDARTFDEVCTDVQVLPDMEDLCMKNRVGVNRRMCSAFLKLKLGENDRGNVSITGPVSYYNTFMRCTTNPTPQPQPKSEPEPELELQS